MTRTNPHPISNSGGATSNAGSASDHSTPPPPDDRSRVSSKLLSEASRVLDADELAEFESVIMRRAG